MIHLTHLHFLPLTFHTFLLDFWWLCC